MDVFENRLGRNFILSLQRDDYLLESIEAFIQDNHIKNAYIASGIGCLSTTCIQTASSRGFPIVFDVQNIEGPMEIASMSGTIIDTNMHIHGVLGDKNKIVAGHLMNGCIVQYVAEIVIQELIHDSLTKQLDQNGLMIIQTRED